MTNTSPEDNKHAPKRRRKSAFIGWAISILFLALAVVHVDFHEFVATVARVSIIDIVILVGIYLIGFLVRALRSIILLPSLSFRQALGGLYIGYAANNVLPARLGELVRAQVVGRGCNISRATILSNIFVERIYDGAAIVALLFFGSSLLALPAWADKMRWAGALLFGIALLGIFLIAYVPSFHPPHWLPKTVHRIWASFREGMQLAARSASVLLSTLALSVVVWLLEGVMFIYAISICALPVTSRAAFFVMGVINLSILIPSSPGYVGVFEYAAQLSLGVLGVDPSPATAYAVLIHLCQYVPITVIGFFFLHYFGIQSLTQLSSPPPEEIATQGPHRPE